MAENNITKTDYNVIFKAINEPLMTTNEFYSVSLPFPYEKKDILINVSKVLVERGIISNELEKLKLYASTIGINLEEEQMAKKRPLSNVFIGGSL